MREDLTRKLTHLQDLHRALSQALNRATISLQGRQNNNDYKLDMTTSADSLTSFTTTLSVTYQ